MSDASGWYVDAARPPSARTVMDDIYDAEVANHLMVGESLRRAAYSLVGLADGLLVAAVDVPGERIIGAALAMSDRISMYDRSQLATGLSILLVSGHTAGRLAAVGRAGAVRLMRNMGAARVEMAVMNPCIDLEGCDKITVLSTGEPSGLDLAAEFEALGWSRSSRSPGGEFVLYVAPTWYPWRVESVIIPLNESAPDFQELLDEALELLAVARATTYSRTCAAALPGPVGARP